MSEDANARSGRDDELLIHGPSDTAHALRRVTVALERVAEATGVAVAWLTLPMVVGTFVIVVLRYAFGIGWIWMQEGVLWLHAAVFMLGASYTLRHAAHVRVDIFYRELSARRQALIDIAGTLLFLIPMSVFVLAISWDYVAVSWRIGEGSRDAGGLPFPFVPLLKSVIPLTAVLLLTQALAMLAANVPKLLGEPGPPGAPGARHAPSAPPARSVHGAPSAQRAPNAHRARSARGTEPVSPPPPGGA